MDSADETRISSSPRAGHGPDPFAPGTILAGRYRIVAPLGRGGMGEVFRADDLTLGAPVALKFLPESLQHDDDARARLVAETRLARTISHPNVCRVYDVGELPAPAPIERSSMHSGRPEALDGRSGSKGRLFLTMEYIDGEDLASLLRRIGRLPSAKTIEIARQLCAGLAAAHERGVLHRDLKPANVMIDGRGHARITDFGLAVDKHVAGTAGDFAGTIAYMAPERLHGAPATIQCDLYALGLILYEVCTGKHAFRADTFEGWRAAHDSSTPLPPSESSGDIDPALERVMLRCLEKTPARRPSSAAVVAASLPGGDPLAAAIAAGETPSPELVAASGEEGTLPRRAAWSWLGAAVLALAATATIGQWAGLSDLLTFNGGPEVLQARARTVLASLGYTTAPRDNAWSIETEPSGMGTIGLPEPPAPRFDYVARIRPTPVTFRYRQAPVILWPNGVGGAVSDTDPAPVAPDDIVLHLDTTGNLSYLRVMPARRESGPADVREPDWRPLISAAGLADVALTVEAPRVIPPIAFETRRAWTGTLDDQRFRFEAAAFRGRVVFAQWGSAGDRNVVQGQSSNRYLDASVSLVWTLMTAAIALLARRNVTLGRGDRRGARRVAGFVLAAGAASSLLGRHWSADPTWLWNAFEGGLGTSLFYTAFVWLAYLALEPFARRTWPHMLIGWARLIDGRWRNPLVGQSLLAGVVFGSFVAVAGHLPVAVGRLLGLGRTDPWYWRGLQPATDYIGFVANGLEWGAIQGLGIVAVMVICRFALRSDRAAFVVTALVVALNSFNWLFPLALWVAQAVLIGVGSVIVVRSFGLLALTAGFAVNIILRSTPWTFDLTKWFAWRPIMTVVIVMALALWGFRNVLGRQSALPKLALD